METDQILQVIGSCAREVLPDLARHPFTRTDRLVDLGANSIDRAEIINMVLEQLALDIPRTQTFGPRDLGELADLLREKLRLA